MLWRSLLCYEPLHSVFATDACGSLPLEFKEQTEIRGIPALKFVAAKKALWTNFTEALGFCSQLLPNMDLDKCARPSDEDPEVLDLSRCRIKGTRINFAPFPTENYMSGNSIKCYFIDQDGRSTCNADGTRNLESCINAPIVMSYPYFHGAPGTSIHC